MHFAFAYLQINSSIILYTMKLLILLSIPSVLGAINGRCSGNWDTFDCICLDRDKCHSYGGQAWAGGPGTYPCPHDPPNVWACKFARNCPHYGNNTACSWRENCHAQILAGKCPQPTVPDTYQLTHARRSCLPWWEGLCLLQIFLVYWCMLGARRFSSVIYFVILQAEC